MDPPKRGRGRPRKIKIQEPPIIPENPEPEPGPEIPEPEPEPTPEIPEPPPEITEPDIIHLVGALPTMEASSPEAPPQAPVKPSASTIVYLPAPSSVEDAKVMVDEKARRNNALIKIKRYRENFEAVRAMRFNEDWSTDALESHLEDIRRIISNKTGGILVKSAYTMACKGVEVGTCAIGMKTYGLADLLSKNKEIDSILLELNCELGVGNLPAHVRLAMATVSTVFVLDSVNKRAEVLSSFKKEAVNESIANKYGDL